MKSSPYPMRKRLTALLLVLILCLSSSGSAAFAEEFFLWEEEPAEVSFEPELFEELIEEEAVEDNPCEEELILFEDASPADTAEADAEELFFEVEQDTFEAAPEQTFLAGETAVFEAQPQPEAVPGTVRLAAGADLFPAGASLSVTPLPQAEAAETLTLDDSESFDSAEAESEDSSDAEVPDDLIYDEAIPDGDEILLVNPRRASDVNANCSVTTEAVASYRYEISMLSPEGEALQPPEGERVTLAFDLPEASDESLDVKVLYLPASGAEEELPARVEDGTVYAETSGFSTFVVNFSRTERLYTATSSVPTPVKNIVDSVVTEEKNLYVVYAYSSHPNLVKVFKDMDIWFVEAPWVFDETVTLTVGTSPWEGDVSATAEYTITVKSHLPGIPYRKLGESLECTKYTLMSSIKEQMGMTLKDGWYIVDKDVTFEKHRLTVLGDVHLILRDGCTLTCKYGIRTATNVDPNTALTVYAEDQGTGLLRCEVNYDRRTTESFYAGIGGNRNEDCGVVTVYGGEIKAVGAIQGAGIGGGTGGNLRGFTMYDGTVTVKGKKGAGVGGGKGGTITGPIAVHGGLLTATSLSNDAQDPTNYSAAIGAGRGGKTGPIRITGGRVYAYGRAKYGEASAGIGGSLVMAREGTDGGIEISGGTVFACGGYQDEGVFGSDIGDGMTYSRTTVNNNPVVITGGNVVLAHFDNERARFSQSNCAVTNLAQDASGRVLHAVVVPLSTPDAPVEISGLAGYGTRDLYADASGDLYLWLPDGDYTFAIGETRWAATVAGADTVAQLVSPADPLGVFVNGVEVAHGTGDGWRYSAVSSRLTLTGDGPLVLSGTNTQGKVRVRVETEATVTLSNLCLKATANRSTPFAIVSNLAARVWFTGTNTLEAGRYCAALEVPGVSDLEIGGDGWLFANGGATSDYWGCPAIGISDGMYYEFQHQSVTVTGGNIVALSGAVGTVSGIDDPVISGGNIYIGRHPNYDHHVLANSGAKTPQGDNAACVEVPGLEPNAPVVFTGLPEYYNASNIYANAEGKVYLYLKAVYDEADGIAFAANGARYNVVVWDSSAANTAEKIAYVPPTALHIESIAAAEDKVTLVVSAEPDGWLTAETALLLRVRAAAALPLPEGDAALLPREDVEISANGDGTATATVPRAADAPQMFYDVEAP